MEQVNKPENTKDNSNNQPEEIKQINKEMIEEKSVQIKEKSKKGKARKWIVLAFLLLAFIVIYIIYRGEYLETLELGEEYLSIFWQNITYRFATFGITFVLLYFFIYMTNRSIKKGLKPFFEQEKKSMPKLPNKSIAFILYIIISFVKTNVIM